MNLSWARHAQFQENVGHVDQEKGAKEILEPPLEGSQTDAEVQRFKQKQRRKSQLASSSGEKGGGEGRQDRQSVESRADGIESQDRTCKIKTRRNFSALDS